MGQDFLAKPTHYEEGETIVVHRHVQQTARIDRTHWEKVDHNPSDAAVWQVGTVAAVDEYGQPSHVSVAAGETDARIGNSRANMRIIECFKSEEPFHAPCRKVIGQVFPSREGLVESIRTIASG